MSQESSLSVKYSDILVEVGAFLGYGPDPSNWSDDQRAEIDRYVNAGVRQFYYPPAIPGIPPDFEWSFLKPMAEIETQKGVSDYDLPANFSRLAGDLYFEPSVYCNSIVAVSQARIMGMRQRSTEEGRPTMCSVISLPEDRADGQRFALALWPTPSAEWVLSYAYEAYTGNLTEENPYPLGGMKHSDLIIESCLAIAEQRANDEKGLHWDAFASRLVASVALDRKMGARYFGHMGESLEKEMVPRRPVASSYPVSYKGVSW